MSDNLANIKEIIEEHQTIRGNLKLVGDSITDQEALISLKSTRSDWSPGQLDILTEKQNKLQQTINFLSEGLTNHFALEEKVLPQFLGGFLMRALRLEHQAIRKAIHEAKSIAANTKLEGLSQEELISQDSDMQQRVNGLCHLIEEHADREDLMLEMVQQALVANG